MDFPEISWGGSDDFSIRIRDSGFGMQVSPDQLHAINSLLQGTEYIDNKVAATQTFSTVAKPTLKESPFVWNLLIRAKRAVTGTASTWPTSWKMPWIA